VRHYFDRSEDFLRSHFSELLLTAILVLLVWIGARAGLEKTKEWAMGQANTVIGAIIMLVTREIKNRITGDNETKVTVTDEHTVTKDGQ